MGGTCGSFGGTIANMGTNAPSLSAAHVYIPSPTIAECKGDMQAGQPAHQIVPALQKLGAPQQCATSGQAMQCLLEGLCGAAML